jgi:DNA polymerase-3 subunit epsilon
MREIVLDTETTGMDPNAGHRIVEIGCVELMRGMRTGNVFHRYINPQRDVPEGAFKVHGLSEAFLKSHPVFAAIAGDLLEFIGDSPLVIHNAVFDMKFVNAEIEALGFPAIPMSRAVDTLMLARKKFPGAPASLNALCKRFEIDLSAREKHGALLDAELLAEVYLELLGGRQVVLGLEKSADEQEAIYEAAQQERAHRPARVFAVSQQEQDAHEHMLSLIKSPLWQSA